jgi:hypothetical protein
MAVKFSARTVRHSGARYHCAQARDKHPVSFANGQIAASKGHRYGDNPHVRGSEQHLAWSQGHNEWRATMAYLREQLG